MKHLTILLLATVACTTNGSTQASHRQAAEEFVETMQVEKTMNDVSGIMADAAVKTWRTWPSCKR